MVLLKAATATKADAEWWALRQTGNDTSTFGARQGEVSQLDVDIDIYIDTYVSLYSIHRVQGGRGVVGAATDGQRHIALWREAGRGISFRYRYRYRYLDRYIYLYI